MAEINRNSGPHPNDPFLFASLIANITALCDRYGEPFYLTFNLDFDPLSQDREYFFDLYPESPEHLVGAGGLLSREEMEDYEGDTEDLVIFNAGTEVQASSLGPDGTEYECRFWMFDRDFRMLYDRIGEMALAPVVVPNENVKENVYWIENNCTVWARPLDEDTGRTQLNDNQLDLLVRTIQLIIPW